MANSFFSNMLGSGTDSNSTFSILHSMKNYTDDPSAAATAANVTILSRDDLIADYAQFRDSHGKAQGILKSTSAIISVIASSIFIWMIMRSHDRLSTTQNRLFLGLCISDILLSLTQSTFNVHAASDNDYFVWNARGNEASCDAQGFLVTLGAASGLFYNASLTVYFLAVVKYNKSDEFIRAKIEPFLHGIPIAVATSDSIYLLIKKHYNDNGNGTCIMPFYNAPHCQGYEAGEVPEGFEIPCWRGKEGAASVGISANVLMCIPVVTIIVSLGMIYRAVRSQENKLSRYGVGALSANFQQQQQQQQSTVWGRMSMSLAALTDSVYKSRAWPGSLSFCNKKTTTPVITTSNSRTGTRSQSRAVMHKAFGYTFAWFLSYGALFISRIVQIATSTSTAPLVLRYFVSIFVPLQGLFNLLIFLHPKIMAAKGRRGESLSWCEAFYAALWSRGAGRKRQGQSRSNLRKRGDRHRKKKTIGNDDMSQLKLGNIQAPTFSSRIKHKKKKKTARDGTIHEEEKCEIQAPDDWNQRNTKAMYTTVSSATSTTYSPNITPSTVETKSSISINSSGRSSKSSSSLIANLSNSAITAEEMNNEMEENADVGHALSEVKEDPDEDEDDAARPISSDVKE